MNSAPLPISSVEPADVGLQPVVGDNGFSDYHFAGLYADEVESPSLRRRLWKTRWADVFASLQGSLLDEAMSALAGQAVCE